MMPIKSYAIWSIWGYLPMLDKLFFLILSLVSIYTLFSPTVIMVRLRSLTGKHQVEDVSSLQSSLAVFRARCVSLRQPIGMTFYLFGFVFFLTLPFVFITLGDGPNPLWMAIFDNLLVYFAFATNAFFVFLALHSAQWFVSGRVNASALRLNPRNIA